MAITIESKLGDLAVKCMGMAFSLQYDWYKSVDHDGSAPMDEKLEADIKDLIQTGEAVYTLRGLIRCAEHPPEGLSEDQINTVLGWINRAEDTIAKYRTEYPTILGECK